MRTRGLQAQPKPSTASGPNARSDSRDARVAPRILRESLERLGVRLATSRAAPQEVPADDLARLLARKLSGALATQTLSE